VRMGNKTEISPARFSPKLLSFLMQSVFSAAGAVFFNLNPIRIISPIFLTCVIALFTIFTG
jgi:hypothetical protein